MTWSRSLLEHHDGYRYNGKEQYGCCGRYGLDLYLIIIIIIKRETATGKIEGKKGQQMINCSARKCFMKKQHIRDSKHAEEH